MPPRPFPVPSTLIKMGSSTMLAMVPIMLPTMASRLAPSARTMKLAAADQMIKGAPQAMCRVYPLANS